MKKALWMIIVIILTLLLISCQSSSTKDEWSVYALTPVQDCQLQQSNDAICVPLTPVLLAYDYKIVWQSDSSAIVSKNDKIYVLDLNTNSFYPEQTTSANSLIPAKTVDSIDYQCYSKNEELYLDVNTLYELLEQIETLDGFRIDYESRAIYIGN